MARLSMAEKEKRTPKFLKKIFGSPKKDQKNFQLSLEKLIELHQTR